MKKWEVSLCILLGFCAALGLKFYYGNASSDALLWILAPTAWWTKILGGPAFLYEPGVGYVNHEIRFIIAPSCAGVRFMMLSLLMLIATFVPRMKSRWHGFTWTALCFPGAWVATGFVNGVRMVLSIYLPELFQGLGLMGGWLSWERLHTMIGTSVYFASLLVLYRIGERISGFLGAEKLPSWGRNGVPALCYSLMVLGIPFFRRVIERDYTGFGPYAAKVLGVCLGILCLTRLGKVVRESKNLRSRIVKGKRGCKREAEL